MTPLTQALIDAAGLQDAKVVSLKLEICADSVPTLSARVLVDVNDTVITELKRYELVDVTDEADIL